MWQEYVVKVMKSIIMEHVKKNAHLQDQFMVYAAPRSNHAEMVTNVLRNALILKFLLVKEGSQHLFVLILVTFQKSMIWEFVRKHAQKVLLM